MRAQALQRVSNQTSQRRQLAHRPDGPAPVNGALAPAGAVRAA